MADVEVHSAELTGGSVQTLGVRMHGLAPRSIDRATALAWLHDGHSFIPVVNGRRAPALQLIEVDGARYIRSDTSKIAEDAIPALADP